MATDPISEANEAIRAFMRLREGRPLFTEEQEEYRQLLEAWAVAVHGSVAEAA